MPSETLPISRRIRIQPSIAVRIPHRDLATAHRNRGRPDPPEPRVGRVPPDIRVDDRALRIEKADFVACVREAQDRAFHSPGLPAFEGEVG